MNGVNAQSPTAERDSRSGVRAVEGLVWENIHACERPDRANESGLSNPSASLDYTEERPG